jgi:hypothetical protein
MWLYKIDYMEHKDSDIIGLDEEGKKIRGIAEFSFSNHEKIDLNPILPDVVPKKKRKHEIVIKDGRKPKSRKGSELF